MRVLLLGASRNIGHLVAQRLLAKGHTCTLLLRFPETMESSPALSSYIKDGKAKLVRGDGLVEADVQHAWDAARVDGEVDAVFFGIGGNPTFSLLKGFVITPADLTARSMAILLNVIHFSTTAGTRPKLITITSNGLDARTHSLLPFPLKPFYRWLLHVPHKDKIEQENNVKHAAGWDGSNEAWLGSQNLTIIRPSLLTRGKCMADTKKNAYRAETELRGAWRISRADIAHFVVEVFNNWETWGGKVWVVSY